MESISLLNAYQTHYTPEITRAERSKQSSTASAGSFGDTVTISEEAKMLAAQMSAQRSVENTEDTLFEKDPSRNMGEEGQGGEGMEGAAATQSAESSLESQISQLEERIAKLNQQVAAIMSGPGEPEAKMDKAQPLQQQATSLQQQLQALRAQLMQQTQAST